jgi:hypothetical protein
MEDDGGSKQLSPMKQSWWRCSASKLVRRRFSNDWLGWEVMGGLEGLGRAQDEGGLPKLKKFQTKY